MLMIKVDEKNLYHTRRSLNKLFRECRDEYKKIEGGSLFTSEVNMINVQKNISLINTTIVPYIVLTCSGAFIVDTFSMISKLFHYPIQCVTAGFYTHTNYIKKTIQSIPAEQRRFCRYLQSKELCSCANPGLSERTVILGAVSAFTGMDHIAFSEDSPSDKIDTTYLVGVGGGLHSELVKPNIKT